MERDSQPAAGQRLVVTADPAALCQAGVTASAVPVMRAFPLSRHPPPGAGTATPDAAPAPVPVTGIVTVVAG